MPIDRRHAFGDGRVYGRPGSSVRLLGHAAELFARIGVRCQVTRAWNLFDAVASLEAGCLLGPAASCVNTGPRDRVRLGAETVCRGTLRREHFGDGHLTIGERVYIGDDCIISCCDSIAIGDNTLIGHGAQIFDNDSHPIDHAMRVQDWSAVVSGARRPTHSIRHAPVYISESVWIGFGSIVLKGVSIGRGAVVAAGSVVTDDVDALTVVAGIPALPVRRLN